MLRSFHRKSDKCETAPLSTIAQHTSLKHGAAQKIFSRARPRLVSNASSALHLSNSPSKLRSPPTCSHVNTVQGI